MQTCEVSTEAQVMLDGHELAAFGSHACEQTPLPFVNTHSPEAQSECAVQASPTAPGV
jgi:hypothetical protein